MGSTHTVVLSSGALLPPELGFTKEQELVGIVKNILVTIKLYSLLMRLLPMNLAGNSSVSRIPIIMEVVGNGIIKCELVRHLSPLTVSTILRSMPISGRLHYLGTKLVYFETGLDMGAEKQRTIFNKGDIGYMTSNGSLCVVLQDISGIMMNPVGRVLDNLDPLFTLPTGQTLSIKRI